MDQTRTTDCPMTKNILHNSIIIGQVACLPALAKLATSLDLKLDYFRR